MATFGVRRLRPTFYTHHFLDSISSFAEMVRITVKDC